MEYEAYKYFWQLHNPDYLTCSVIDSNLSLTHYVISDKILGATFSFIVSNRCRILSSKTPFKLATKCWHLTSLLLMYCTWQVLMARFYIIYLKTLSKGNPNSMIRLFIDHILLHSHGKLNNCWIIPTKALEIILCITASQRI